MGSEGFVRFIYILGDINCLPGKFLDRSSNSRSHSYSNKTSNGKTSNGHELMRG